MRHSGKYLGRAAAVDFAGRRGHEATQGRGGMSETTATEPEIVRGCVKWFDPGKGSVHRIDEGGGIFCFIQRPAEIRALVLRRGQGPRSSSRGADNAAPASRPASPFLEITPPKRRPSGLAGSGRARPGGDQPPRRSGPRRVNVVRAKAKGFWFFCEKK